MNKLSKSLEEQGYLPAMQVLSETSLEYLTNFSLEDPNVAKANFSKRLWKTDPAVREIVFNQAIIDTLEELFKDDGFYLWGAQIIDRNPGQDHGWHSDIETAREGFISLWIGIAGLSAETSLKVIPGSHKLGKPVQEFFALDDSARHDPAAGNLLKKLPANSAHRKVERLDCPEGSGVFFDGRIWHSTFNESKVKRRSLLLQFGRHGVPVRHYLNRTSYPFEYDLKNVPHVLSLKGEPDPVANKTLTLNKEGDISAPIARTHARRELSVKSHQGWTRHPYFQAETPIMESLTCHASVLRSGVMPHTPHAHDDEEILIVLSGSGGVITQHGTNGEWRVAPARAGDVFYYPCKDPHTIINSAMEPDAAPLAYLMFRWGARNPDIQDATRFKISSKEVRKKKRISIDRPSSRLSKLHVHTSRLQPGESFPRHIDRYDSTFVVLAGELTVIDQTLGPGGVFLTRAGELHNTANVGTTACFYLVFEFHDHDR